MLSRGLPTVALLLMIPLLTACTTGPDRPTPSSTASSTAASTPSAAPTPSTSPSTDAERRYVSAVQQLSTTLASVDPALLLALGRDVCRSFSRGETAAQVADDFGTATAGSGFTGSEAAVIIGAAVPTLCPQYRSRLSAG